MKIFYAVQATGNGHISRAAEILPYLQRYGKVDIFLSGNNCQLQNTLPVRYRSRGISLFYNNLGGLEYRKLAAEIRPAGLWKEIRELPVQNYDVVINDFEPITALACATRKIPSVNFGHQAAFISPLSPRPAKKDLLGEFLLKNYARASKYVGLHFESYDDFIFTPVIKKAVSTARSRNMGHITVYLSAYSDEVLLNNFRQFPSCRFEVFSKTVRQQVYIDNVVFLPVNQRLFNESMINSQGVITGAGFETPAEVLHLGKKLMVIPIRGQYEQLCNAAALERLGVTVVKEIGTGFPEIFTDWMSEGKTMLIKYENNIPELLDYLMDNYPQQKVPLELLYPEMLLG